ncbi:MAG: hypothetical protein FJ291_26040 [Planctomycetes bacterium]|nr:hypothetical protein [Planctomycetota bacterium]
MAAPPTSGPFLPLEAYKLLTGLLQHEEALFWKRNEIMLLINTGLLAIVGLGKAAPGSGAPGLPSSFALLVCLIGLLMCALWLIIVRRSQAFYNHWYEQLKFLERTKLDPVKTFQLADDYFEKGHVMLGDRPFDLGPIARRMRIYDAMTAAPVIFGVVWIVVAVLRL